MQIIHVDDLVHIITRLVEKDLIRTKDTMWWCMYNYVDNLEPGEPISDELYMALLEPIDAELLEQEAQWVGDEQ